MFGSIFFFCIKRESSSWFNYILFGLVWAICCLFSLFIGNSFHYIVTPSRRRENMENGTSFILLNQTLDKSNYYYYLFYFLFLLNLISFSLCYPIWTKQALSRQTLIWQGQGWPKWKFSKHWFLYRVCLE